MLILILLFATVLIVITCLGITVKNRRNYKLITEDIANTCNYDENGTIVGGTKVAPEKVSHKIPIANYEQFRKNAIATGRCIL